MDVGEEEGELVGVRLEEEEEPWGPPKPGNPNWRFWKPLGVEVGELEGELVGVRLEEEEEPWGPPKPGNPNWRFSCSKPEGVGEPVGVPLGVPLGVPVGVGKSDGEPVGKPVGCSRFSKGILKGRLEELLKMGVLVGVGRLVEGGPVGVGASLERPGGPAGPWGRARAQPIKPIAAKLVYFIVDYVDFERSGLDLGYGFYIKE